MGIQEIRRIKEQSLYPKPKKVYTIPKKSEKKKRQEILAKGDDDSLDLWFEERKKDLTGKCQHCGGKTWTPEDDSRIKEAAGEDVYRNDGKFYRHCICHILPKAYFPSVATHPLNFIELCFWGNNCHANMDNKVLDLTEMACWHTIVERFVAMYPSIEKSERRRIPGVLMQYVEIDL